MKNKDLISVADLSPADVSDLVNLAVEYKSQESPPALAGSALALIFEKPSLRTRTSFQVAMWQLGGNAIYLSRAEVGLGEREPIEDVARVLSGYVNGIVARTFSHRTIELLAKYAAIPVINALSDEEHPCQALADLLTIYETKRQLKGLTVAFIGDGNNVANSLMLASALAGLNFRIGCPMGYEPSERYISKARRIAGEGGSQISVTNDPAAAAEGADVIYTDVWTSMGQEAERERREADFAGYQVDGRLMSLARPDAIFMHPLPAHRTEEVAADVIDSAQSVVFHEAENRLHIQKAVLVRLLNKS